MQVNINNFLKNKRNFIRMFFLGQGNKTNVSVEHAANNNNEQVVPTISQVEILNENYRSQQNSNLYKQDVPPTYEQALVMPQNNVSNLFLSQASVAIRS